MSSAPPSAAGQQITRDRLSSLLKVIRKNGRAATHRVMQSLAETDATLLPMKADIPDPQDADFIAKATIWCVNALELKVTTDSESVAEILCTTLTEFAEQIMSVLGDVQNDQYIVRSSVAKLHKLRGIVARPETGLLAELDKLAGLRRASNKAFMDQYHTVSRLVETLLDDFHELETTVDNEVKRLEWNVKKYGLVEGVTKALGKEVALMLLGNAVVAATGATAVTMTAGATTATLAASVLASLCTAPVLVPAGLLAGLTIAGVYAKLRVKYSSTALVMAKYLSIEIKYYIKELDDLNGTLIASLSDCTALAKKMQAEGYRLLEDGQEQSSRGAASAAATTSLTVNKSDTSITYMVASDTASPSRLAWLSASIGIAVAVVVMGVMTMTL